MLRNVVLGSGILALVPSVKAATPVIAVKEEATGPKKPPPMKVSELPIYEAPHAEYVEYIQRKSKEESGALTAVKSSLLEPVSAVREQVQNVWQQTAAIKHSIQDNYHELQDRTDWIVQYLREEDNKEQRYGAVAMGGLTGFILGLRGGIIKRLFYATLGTTAMGYVCFPEETSELVNENAKLPRQYANIAYNFLYGVKPGDPQLEIKFPELSIPKDLSELTALAVSVASTVKQAVMPPPAKDADKPSEKKE